MTATTTATTTTRDAGHVPEPATYSFGRRDRGGLLLGFTAPQLFCLGTGFGAVLGGLLLGSVPLGFTLLAAMGVLALYPVQGRVLVDWARPLANHAHAKWTGRATYLGGPHALHRRKDLVLDLPG